MRRATVLLGLLLIAAAAGCGGQTQSSAPPPDKNQGSSRPRPDDAKSGDPKAGGAQSVPKGAMKPVAD